MRSCLLTLVAGLVAGSAFGQGAVDFTTRSGSVNAPVINAFTGELVAGAAYLAQLYYGQPGAEESSLVPVLDAQGRVAAPVTFGTGVLAGYIVSGIGGAGNRYTDIKESLLFPKLHDFRHAFV